MTAKLTVFTPYDAQAIIENSDIIGVTPYHCYFDFLWYRFDMRYVPDDKVWRVECDKMPSFNCEFEKNTTIAVIRDTLIDQVATAMMECNPTTNESAGEIVGAER